MNIILNGASGSGKGSMAGFLVRDFGLVHTPYKIVTNLRGKKVQEILSLG